MNSLSALDGLIVNAIITWFLSFLLAVGNVFLTLVLFLANDYQEMTIFLYWFPYEILSFSDATIRFLIDICFPMDKIIFVFILMNI
jgi:hypothetical protein